MGWGCFSLSAVTTSAIGVITFFLLDAIILTAAVASPTRSLELAFSTLYIYITYIAKYIRVVIFVSSGENST